MYLARGCCSKPGSPEGRNKGRVGCLGLLGDALVMVLLIVGRPSAAGRERPSAGSSHAAAKRSGAFGSFREIGRRKKKGEEEEEK